VHEEPIEAIRNGLIICESRREAERAIVIAIAEIANNWARSFKGALRPQQAAFNLLQLAADLAEPEVLNEPLQGLLGKRSAKGDWLGSSLSSALLAAIIVNQNDDSMERVWIKTIQGDPDGFLGGTPRDGFRGLIHAGATDRRPDAEFVGRALKEIAKSLHREHKRRILFRDHIQELQETYPKDWRRDLMREADDHRWPGWAVECLPSLHVEGESGTWFLWRYVVACLPKSFRFKLVSETCGGLVFEIRPRWPKDDPKDRQLAHLANIFEASRGSNPYPTQKATAARLIEDLAPQIERLRHQGWTESEIPDIERISKAFRRLARKAKDEDPWDTSALVRVTKLLFPKYSELLRKGAVSAGVPKRVYQELEVA